MCRFDPGLRHHIVISMKEGSAVSSVSYVTIPEIVKFLEEGAFSWRKSIQRVTIPNTVAAIEAEAFDNTPHLGY